MRIHFIGIGGIGISALAKYFLVKGNKVSGSDLSSSDIIDTLKKMGAEIKIGKQKAENIFAKTDLVLITPAIKKDNPEFQEAKKRKIKIQTWEKALGELTKEHFMIGISGTHGKSTTTSMIGLLLWRAKLDPSVIVGTKLKEFGNNNCRVGKPIRQAQGKIQYLVVEADEYKSSFLNYRSKLVVLTNIELEHPDYFKDLKHYLSVFEKYLLRAKKTDSIVIANRDDKNIVKLINKVGVKKIYYSLKQPETKKIRQIIKLPGEHNIYNALATLATGRFLKIPDKIIFDAISKYKGAWRRFEIKKLRIGGYKLPITLISDYGHHPTQVRVTIAAAKEKFPERKIWMVYQAHQYLRTYYLFDEYVKAFDQADEIVLPEIYYVSGREKKSIVKNLNSEVLAQAIRKRFKKMGKMAKVHSLKSYTEVPKFLIPRIKNGDVIISMGAGDIYRLDSLLQG